MVLSIQVSGPRICQHTTGCVILKPCCHLALQQFASGFWLIQNAKAVELGALSQLDVNHNAFGERADSPRFGFQSESFDEVRKPQFVGREFPKGYGPRLVSQPDGKSVWMQDCEVMSEEPRPLAELWLVKVASCRGKVSASLKRVAAANSGDLGSRFDYPTFGDRTPLCLTRQ